MPAVTRVANFYPRSPCGERRVTVLGIQHKVGISIHALLAESDIISIALLILPIRFLSTLSLRRATMYPSQWRTLASDFYPRSPCGERPLPCYTGTTSVRFLSTLSLRRATGGKIQHPGQVLISIHALLAESDALAMAGYTKAEIISIHALLAESDGNIG